VVLLALLSAQRNVATAAVVSVTLNPATIAGGTGRSSIGTVVIAQPAPAGGQIIDLTSSNTDLAAATQRVRIAEGTTSTTFTVGTNALYRPYSGLAFDATITATDPGDGSSASAVLHVTAQAIPGPFTGGTVSTDARAQAGRMCGGSFGTNQAKERGILYRCEFPQAGQFSVCSFLQECSFGCQTQAASGLNRQDVCATAPPFPVTVDPELVEGGRRSDGTVFVDAPANSLTSANVSSSPGGEVSPGGVFPIPEGARSAPFDVDTFEVAVPAFLQVRADLSLNPLERFAQDYLAVVPAPGTRPPGPLAVFSVDTTPMAVVQGLPSIGVVILNGVAPSGGAVVTLSTNSAAASVPSTVTVPAGQTATSFGVTTFQVASSTVVTITATFGGVSRSTTMTVSPFVFSTATPALADFAVNPTTVVGGSRSTGRVHITTPAPDPSDGAVTIALTSDNEAAVVVARSVTIGFGGTIGDFRIRTFAVAEPTVVTLRATYNGVTRAATLTVNPSGAPVGPPPPPPPSPPSSATLATLGVNPATVVGGASSAGTVMLSAAAPSGGAVIALADNSNATSVPASVTVPAGSTSANFTVTTSPVTTPTSATISAVYGGVTRTATLTVNPSVPSAPSLVSPANGATLDQPVTLDWTDVANAASYEVQVDNTSTLAAPFVANPTVAVSQVTLSGLPAQRLWWRVRARNAAGVLGPFSSARRFTPRATTTTAPALSAVSVNPASVAGGNGSTGTATLTAAAPAGGAVVSLASSQTSVATVPASVTIAAGATSATFAVTTSSVAANTAVTITASYGGVNRTTTLTVTPVAAAASLQAVSLNPATVTGGSGSTGTATLTTAAPAGGAVVSLASSNPGVATVPASVTIAAGATSATFAATTSSVASSTPVTITASYGGANRTATLTVSPPSQAATLTVTATGRSGERVTSSPAGINVSVGTTGSASFATGTSITLSVSNGRDAIWSGACSSGGNKTRTCTFTFTGNATVTGNVQ
jgi:hypothetical protein